MKTLTTPLLAVWAIGTGKVRLSCLQLTHESVLGRKPASPRTRTDRHRLQTGRHSGTGAGHAQAHPRVYRQAHLEEGRRRGPHHVRPLFCLALPLLFFCRWSPLFPGVQAHLLIVLMFELGVQLRRFGERQELEGAL